MEKNTLRSLEIEVYNATRKFANIKNKEKGKKIFFAKMEDQISNGLNSTIFTLECLGNLKENGFVRAIYSTDPYDELEWKIKIDGQMIRDKITSRYLPHKIVKEYTDFIIKEVYGIKGKVKEHTFNHNNTSNSYNNENR
jgi:hypothetical protein